MALKDFYKEAVYHYGYDMGWLDKSKTDYDLVGYWCWDEISVEDASFDTTGYEMLPLDFCEHGNIRSETYEKANK